MELIFLFSEKGEIKKILYIRASIMLRFNSRQQLLTFFGEFIWQMPRIGILGYGTCLNLVLLKPKTMKVSYFVTGFPFKKVCLKIKIQYRFYKLNSLNCLQ